MRFLLQTFLSLLSLATLSTGAACDAASLKKLWTYATGSYDTKAAEVLAYDQATSHLYVVNGHTPGVDVLDIKSGRKIGELSVAMPGSPNGIAAHNGLIAVAVAAKDKTRPGSVVFFDARTSQYVTAVKVGANPDMLTFTPDGKKLIVANEGEPSDDYSRDPEGSISVVDLADGVQHARASTAGFAKYNDRRDELLSAGVRIFGPSLHNADGKATVAEDLEPEYIAVAADGKTAWITLQENNALAILDISSSAVSSIVPLGYKDHRHAGKGLDASDKDGKINIQEWPVFGMYQPDTISAYQARGKTYLITANEGDARPQPACDEAVRVEDLRLASKLDPKGNLAQRDRLGRLQVARELGDSDGDGEYESLYVYGGRSFAIWDAKGKLVFDSGDQFERVLAERYPKDFNADNEENHSFDSRSDNKGPEPEGIAVGVVDDRTLAFIGLERMGGIMIYAVTEPQDARFIDYVSGRNFQGTADDGSAGDLGPEGLQFIAADSNPLKKPLLAVANEISGTTTLYEVSVQ